VVVPSVKTLTHTEEVKRMRAYLFDLGNVVARFDHWIFCRRLAAVTGTLTPEAVHQSVFSGTLNEEFEIGRISGEKFYASLSSRVPFDLPPFDQFKGIWCDIFEENPGMVDMIQTLRTRSRVVLVSNTNQWHIDFFRERFPHIIACFDAMILSYEVGIRKPDPGIFRLAVEAARTDPSHCLYFDDIQTHVMAARQIGIRAVLFQYV